MRLWSLHACYLDRAGLCGAWREGLLAQAVLLGRTKGYTNHPQLARFRQEVYPVACIGSYLDDLATEAELREYSFNRELIEIPYGGQRLDVTEGQLRFERNHLLQKLERRGDRRRHTMLLAAAGNIKCSPCFHIIPGDVEHWERQV